MGSTLLYKLGNAFVLSLSIVVSLSLSTVGISKYNVVTVKKKRGAIRQAHLSKISQNKWQSCIHLQCERSQLIYDNIIMLYLSLFSLLFKYHSP